MNFTQLKKCIFNQIVINSRLKTVCLWYLLFLMISVRKHSLTEGAKFSGLKTSQLSRFLKNHPDIAVYNLDQLSKKSARQFSSAIDCLANGKVPWKIAVIIDNTHQRRASLHTDNSQGFSQGKGYQIGHQWTNVILLINDQIIPLCPIPFYTKNYCRKNGLEYKTENILVVEYIEQLNLEDYIGIHDPKHVIVLADSGYDDRKIEKTIIKKKWRFIIALKKTRSIKSIKKYHTTPRYKKWSQVAQFFKDHRRVPWQTIRITTNRSKKRRMEFRIRQIKGYLRHVDIVQLICSEFKKRPKGRKKYLACSDLKATARQIILGYRMRWTIETFHKQVKMFLGFEDVAPKWFSSVISHVHWVYCAYILLSSIPLAVTDNVKSLSERQDQIRMLIDSKEKNRVIQLLTRINGTQRYKTELQWAIAAFR